MNINRAIVAACFAAAAGSLPVPTAARADAAAETAAGWITVTAPHVDHTVARKGKAVAEVVAITHRVEVADLDLTMYADVKELETRIAEQAKVACEQLAVLYPTDNPDIPRCTREAVANATEQAQRLIDAANAKR